MSGIKQKHKNEIDMINGPLLSKIVAFTIPVMFSSILQLLFNAADIIVVGKYAGDESLAAVGSTSSLINLLTNLFIGLSVGSNVLVAQYVGAGEKERISRTVHTSILLSVICGIFLTVVGFMASRPMLSLMGSPYDVIDLASLYLKIYFLGMPAMLFYNFGAAMLRAVGDTKNPLVFLTVAGFINVILNLVFVICFSMGVAGVGIATVVSQYISALLVFGLFVKSDGPLKADIKALRIDSAILKRIVKIGIPAGFQGTIFSLSNVVIQSTVNSFGSRVIAGNSAAMNIEGFVYVAMNSVHQAAITFTGQNYGAGRKDRILKVNLLCLLLVTATGLVFGNAAYLFGRSLLRIYTDSEQVVAYGMDRVKIICTVYFLCGIMDVMVGSLRGIGRAVLPMIVSILGACGLRLLYIATVYRLNPTTTMLYLAYPISWTITFLVHVICFVIAFRKLDLGKKEN